MLSLSATFEKSNGRKHTWRLKHANRNKTAEEIRTQLEKLTTLDIFEKNGVNFFEKVVKAKFIETIETSIFDKEAEDQTEVSEASEAPRGTRKNPAHTMQTIQEPKDLIVEQSLIKPGMLELFFELPNGIEPQDISESEAAALILAMVPKGGEIEDFGVIEGTQPVRFRLLVKLEEDLESLNPAIAPSKAKKKRGRLIDRLRKRRSN